jgi:hypothetical protein
VAAALALTGGVGGCAEVVNVWSPPHFDQSALDDLNTVRTGADALFGRLQTPSPHCLYSNNTTGFDTLAADISAARTRAATITNNKHMVNGLTDLGASVDHYRKAASASTTNCLPANIARNQQTHMDHAIQLLIDFEKAQPR